MWSFWSKSLFIDEPIENRKQIHDVVNSTCLSVVSALAAFYRNKGKVVEAKAYLHIVSKLKDDLNDTTTWNNNYYNNDNKNKHSVGMDI